MENCGTKEGMKYEVHGANQFQKTTQEATTCTGRILRGIELL